MIDFARLAPPKLCLAIAAVLLALAVSAGAFGAHALRDRLDDYSRGVYEKAVFYHFLHSFGMLVVAVAGLAKVLPDDRTSLICVLLGAGVVIFSGSLYALALTGVKGLGAITPIGGVLFIVAWIVLALTALR